MFAAVLMPPELGSILVKLTQVQLLDSDTRVCLSRGGGLVAMGILVAEDNISYARHGTRAAGDWPCVQ